MSENKYEPLTEQEFTELNLVLDAIGAYLPEDKMGYIWSNFNRVRNTNENQPCGCASAGGHWKRAVDHLRQWVKERT
jgi:hypothetical protein